jgi:hypothetical protein
MAMRLIILILLHYIGIGYGYILDHSCNDYKQMIVDGMSSAFKLNAAAANLLSSLSFNKDGSRLDGPDLDKFQAQKDLFSFLFGQAMTAGNVNISTEGWKIVTGVFTSIKKFDIANGQPRKLANTFPILFLTDYYAYYCTPRYSRD